MGIYDNWTYTDLHQLNLDWLIKHVKEVENNLDSAKENAQKAGQSALEAKQNANLAQTYAEQAHDAVETLAGVNRRYIMLGDSYGQGWSPESTSVGWPLRIKDILNINDDDFYTNSIGGVGFCNTINGQNWLTMLTGINATNPETITDIIVAGGYNDKSYSINDIITAITSFLSIAKNLYPNATVRVGMIAYSFETTGNIVKLLKNVLIAYQRTPFINSNGVYMTNIENTLTNSYYMSESDKHHPNNYGLGFIAMNIINCIKTGTCDIVHTQSDSLTLASGVAGNNPFPISSQVDGNNLNVIVGPGIITGTFTYSGANLDLLVGTYTGLTCINGDTNKGLAQTVNAVIRKTVGNQYRETPMMLYITKNELHAVLRLINDAGNNFYSGDITQIQVGGYTAMNSQTFLSF